ncbi:MAG TPA: hypothetical protein VGN19_10635, partial [Pedococcus sp.]|nr:hypothetical protein [Pedococcus sp.]
NVDNDERLFRRPAGGRRPARQGQVGQCSAADSAKGWERPRGPVPPLRFPVRLDLGELEVSSAA